MIDSNLFRQMSLAAHGSATGSVEGNVAGGSSLVSPTWIAALPYNEMAIGVRSDAAHDWDVDILWSHDPTYGAGEVQGETADAVSGVATAYGAGRTPVKAPYFKLRISNADVVAHVMKCWYLLIG